MPWRENGEGGAWGVSSASPVVCGAGEGGGRLGRPSAGCPRSPVRGEEERGEVGSCPRGLTSRWCGGNGYPPALDGKCGWQRFNLHFGSLALSRCSVLGFGFLVVFGFFSFIGLKA